MGIWKDRVELAADEWGTDVRIEHERFRGLGALRIGFWAKTLRWHGGVAEVCLHAHQTCLPGDSVTEALDAISARVHRACLRAKSEFVASVPCQTGEHDGEIRLAENDFETSYWSQHRHDFTKDILDTNLTAPESGEYARAVAETSAHSGIDYDDSLLPYAEPRLVRDVHPREWVFSVSHRIRSIGDDKVKSRSYKSSSFTTRIISESAASGLVVVSGRCATQIITDYAPGGELRAMSDGGLPPGYELVSLNTISEPSP